MAASLPNVNPAVLRGQNQNEAQLDLMAQNFRAFNSNFAEFMDRFAAKMENVLSPGLAVKQSVYGAFGNNIATRGAMAGFDALSEKVTGMFGEAEDPVDNRDPISKAIADQAATIKASIESLKEFVGKPSMDPTAMEKADKTLATLDDISKTLEDILNKECCSDPKLIDQMTALRSIADEILSNLRPGSRRTDSKSWDGEFEDIESKNKTQKKVNTGVSLIPFKAQPTGTDYKAAAMKKIILLLTDNNKVLKKLADGPISTAEETLEKDLKSKIKSNVTTITDIVPKVAAEAESSGFSFKGLMEMAVKLLPVLTTIVTGLKGAGGLLVDAVMSLGGLLFKLLKKLPLGALMAGGAALATGASGLISSGVDMVKTAGTKMSDSFEKVKGKITGPKETVGKGAPAVLTGNDSPLDPIKSNQPKLPDGTVDKTKIPSDGKTTTSTDKTKLPSDVKPTSTNKVGDITDAVIKSEKALEEAPKPKGVLGKIGETLGKVGSKAAKLAKFIPGVGMVVGAADMAYSAGKGAYDAEKIFDTNEATRSQRNASALGGAAESLSFGLLDRDSTAKNIEEFFKRFKSTDNKPGEIDSALKSSDKPKETQTNAPVVVNNVTNNKQSTTLPTKRNPTKNSDYSFNRYIDSSLRSV